MITTESDREAIPTVTVQSTPWVPQWSRSSISISINWSHSQTIPTVTHSSTHASRTTLITAVDNLNPRLNQVSYNTLLPHTPRYHNHQGRQSRPRYHSHQGRQSRPRCYSHQGRQSRPRYHSHQGRQSTSEIQATSHHTAVTHLQSTPAPRRVVLTGCHS